MHMLELGPDSSEDDNTPRKRPVGAGNMYEGDGVKIYLITTKNNGNNICNNQTIREELRGVDASADVWCRENNMTSVVKLFVPAADERMSVALRMVADTFIGAPRCEKTGCNNTSLIRLRIPFLDKYVKKFENKKEAMVEKYGVEIFIWKVCCPDSDARTVGIEGQIEQVIQCVVDIYTWLTTKREKAYKYRFYIPERSPKNPKSYGGYGKNPKYHNNYYCRQCQPDQPESSDDEVEA